MAFLQTAALLGSLAASAYAHGRVTEISAGGESYTGFLNEYLYTDSPPDIVAWSADNGDNGFVDGTSYTSGDIICHREGKPGKISATVAAGSKIDIQWGPDAWPESHHGPVIDYLAKCAGDDCTSVDKETLEFFKIDEAGLIDGSQAPGQWASDELIANDGKWTITIPESLAPGQYVLRHEIIALHSAGDDNGAQNYPQCFNIEVTGSGTANPEGVLGTALYTPEDAGIKISIYGGLESYEIPGPALWDGASSGSGSGSSGNSSGAPFGNSTTDATASAAPTSAAISQVAATSTQAAQSTQTAASSNQGSSNNNNNNNNNQGSFNNDKNNNNNQGSSNNDNSPSNTKAASSAVTSAPSVTKIADSIPSAALTSSIDGAVPTATGTESSDDYPSKPLPEGFTLADLLEWVDYLLTKAFKSEGIHARDFERR